MAPIIATENISIPIAILAKTIERTFKDSLPLTSTVLISFSATVSLLALLTKPKFLESFPNLSNLFNIGLKWTLIRCMGGFFAIVVLAQRGPEIILSKQTGAFLLNELLPVLVCVFLVAGVFLPLLLNFGLIEFFGVLFSKIMRPIFTLPGRSSIDCLASWVGDGTIGVLLTSKQYEEGHYTKREAAVIGTTFSVVSISFATVILTQVGLEHLFLQFYFTIFLAGMVTAIISPRIYPLVSISDTYICGREQLHEEIPKEDRLFKNALFQALKKARENRNIKKILQEGIFNVCDMWLGVLPTVLCFGTIALIIAEHTPLFSYLGIPFVPIFELLQIPNAQQAANTVMLGFADMFLPSVIISNVNNEFTKFVVACLSVSQLIYMSEVGSLLIASKIPVNFKQLLLIFLQRTFLSLPVIAACAHIIF